MEIVFRSSFLLALTCSKRICFPPDTDSFLCVKEWGWSIWGSVPGGAPPRMRIPTNLRFRASQHPFTGAASFPAAVYLLQVVSGCFT